MILGEMLKISVNKIVTALSSLEKLQLHYGYPGKCRKINKSGKNDRQDSEIRVQ